MFWGSGIWVVVDFSSQTTSETSLCLLLLLLGFWDLVVVDFSSQTTSEAFLCLLLLLGFWDLGCRGLLNSNDQRILLASSSGVLGSGLSLTSQVKRLVYFAYFFFWGLDSSLRDSGGLGFWGLVSS